MFDIGFAELIVVSLLGLLVIGPKRLPEVLRTTSLWIGRLRRSFSRLRTEIESELSIDEVRQQLHNEDIMRALQQTEDSAKQATGHSTDTSNNDSTDPTPKTKLSPPTSDDKSTS